MEIDRVILVDIGNTYAKIYKNDKVEKVPSEKFDLQEPFFYIAVKNSIKDMLANNPFGKNLEKYIKIKTDYQGMGIDRKVLCSYIDDGVIVDAGSAITVDIMDKGIHKGGFILAGISSLFEAYEKISPVLKVKRKDNLDILKTPQNTSEAVNYGIIAPIISIIKEVSKDKKIYFTGGDGLILYKYFTNALYDEIMIFKAMKKIIKENLC